MSHLARIHSLRSLPQSFEGLLGSLGVILSSNLAIALLTFGTFALTTRALSPEGLGLLVLIEAYGRMFDLVLRLEPSQALIRQHHLERYRRRIDLIAVDAVGRIVRQRDVVQ